MADITLTLEVFYKVGPENTVNNLERVQYGPFETRAKALGFFEGGVALGVFNQNHYVLRKVNKPSYDPNYQESA